MRFTGLFTGIAAASILALPMLAQTISTAASNSAWGGPLDAKLDGAGNLYVADWGGDAIYKVDLQGRMTVLAGTPGRGGYSGDGAQGTSALINAPTGIALDAAGNVYFADNNNARIRKIGTNGIVTTVAGNGRAGFAGDGGPGAGAMINNPLGMVSDAAGNIYFIDYSNYRIRKVAPNGTISTVAGTGRKNSGGEGGQALTTDMVPSAIAIASDGSLYYADYGFRTDNGGARVRRIAPNGIVSNIAGNGRAAEAGDGGPATAASLASADGVAVDTAGNVYVSEYGAARVRKIDVLTGIITTFAGTGRAGLGGDAGPAEQALIAGAVNMFSDPQGNLYFIEYLNKRVRKVTMPNIPQIRAVESGAAAFAGQAGFASNMYMDISGVYLSPTTRTWTLADFTGSTAPLSLDGVGVKVNNKAAFLRYVSPTGLGIILPDDTDTGPVTLVVQTPAGPSNPGQITRARVSPTLQPSTPLLFGARQYVLAQTPDFRQYVGSPSILGGFPVSAVKPGDTVVIFALACGPTDPAAPAGTIAAVDSPMTLPFELRVGGVPATVLSAGVIANTIGLYQFVATIPAVPPGDQPIELVVDGVSNGQNLLILVGQ